MVCCLTRKKIFDLPPDSGGATGGEEAEGVVSGAAAAASSERPAKLPRLDTYLPDSDKAKKDRPITISTDKFGRPALELESEHSRTTLDIVTFIKAMKQRGLAIFPDTTRPDGLRSDSVSFSDHVLTLWGKHPHAKVQLYYNRVCEAVFYKEAPAFNSPMHLYTIFMDVMPDAFGQRHHSNADPPATPAKMRQRSNRDNNYNNNNQGNGGRNRQHQGYNPHAGVNNRAFNLQSNSVACRHAINCTVNDCLFWHPGQNPAQLAQPMPRNNTGANNGNNGGNNGGNGGRTRS